MAKKSKAKKESKEKKVTIINQYSKPTIYSNHTAIHITNTEITLIFNEILLMSDDELKLREVGTIAMSPQHAKSVYDLLGISLERYENKLSKLIKVPPKEST